LRFWQNENQVSYPSQASCPSPRFVPRSRWSSRSFQTRLTTSRTDFLHKLND